MIRKYLDIGGRRLSYLDSEKPGRPLVCLHGHFGCASMFSFMENVHDGRLILPDQRGHGESDAFASYRTDDYLADLDALIRAENLAGPVILGHSLGGINAIHYASRNRNISALIVEDIGTEVNCSNEFVRKLPREFNSLYEIQEAFRNIGMDCDQYFLESARYDGQKWRFRFDYEGMVESQKEMNGDHWRFWEAIRCPVLLMHGTKSWAASTANIRAMADARANVSLAVYEGIGHTLHDEARERFKADVGAFLRA